MVTEADRQLVRRMDADVSRVIRKGLTSARQIGARVERAAVRAYRNALDYGAAVTMELQGLTRLLAEAMVIARLTGMKRSIALRPLDLRRSPYSAILRNLAFLWGTDELALRHAQEFSMAEASLTVAQTARLLHRRLDEAATMISMQGLHVRDGVKLFHEAFGASGLVPRNSYTAENLLRTQSQMAYATGRYAADQDPAIQNRLWGYTYATAGDERVRLNHAALDGVTLPKDDGCWQTMWPPNGWSCRCQAIPVFDTRPLVEPGSTVTVDGTEVVPGADKGWDFHPGRNGRTGLAA